MPDPVYAKEMRPVHRYPASRWSRAVVLAAVSYAFLATSVVAASETESPITEPVIPPGQEAVIAAMLGRGLALPDCTLVRCGVDQTVIMATYACPDGDVTLELGHPQNATDGSVQTARFAITIQSGTPPPDLGAALVYLVRSREADFVWSWQESVAAAENDTAPE